MVIVHEGRTNFSELQAELAAGKQDRLVFYAFDLLWRNGDMRRLPQIERKQLLLDLLGENDIELIVSPDSRANLARRQAEAALIALCRFPEPALSPITLPAIAFDPLADCSSAPAFEAAQ